VNQLDSVIKSLPSANREAYVRKALSESSSQIAPDVLLQSLLLGGAAGSGFAGLRALSKLLKRAKPVPATYTMPVEANIYSPNEEKPSRSRKAASFQSQLSAATAGPGDSLKFIGTAAAGAGLGYVGANRILTSVAAIARRRQLEEARQDFELALQELATPVDKKKKKPKLAVDPEVLQLAANCQKLASGQTQMGYLKSMLPVVAGLLASGGAYMGYSNYQGKSKRNALDYAERKANMAREAQNPTFMSASLIDAPKEDEQPEDAARQQLLDMLEQEYPYLP